MISDTVTSNHTYLWRSGATGSPAYIDQVLGTTPGAHYELSFDVYNSALTDPKFGAWNDPSYTRLDNVSVVALTSAVPEAGNAAMLLAGLGLFGVFATRRKA